MAACQVALPMEARAAAAFCPTLVYLRKAKPPTSRAGALVEVLMATTRRHVASIGTNTAEVSTTPPRQTAAEIENPTNGGARAANPRAQCLRCGRPCCYSCRSPQRRKLGRTGVRTMQAKSASSPPHPRREAPPLASYSHHTAILTAPSGAARAHSTLSLPLPNMETSGHQTSVPRLVSLEPARCSLGRRATSICQAIRQYLALQMAAPACMSTAVTGWVKTAREQR